MKQSEVKNQKKEDKEFQNQIFVGGCHPDMKEDTLMEYFTKFGEIEEIRMKIDKLTGIISRNLIFF